MSLHLPSRRVVRSAASLATSKSTVVLLSSSIQRRNLWDWAKKDFGFGKRQTMDKTVAPSNPLTEDYLKKKPTAPKGMVRGDLDSSSIFEDEELAGKRPRRSTDPADKAGARRHEQPRNPEYMLAALDPDPANRRRWERKMVIREITKRGRLSKTQLLKKEERQLISKSHDFKTSVKKLVPLAKQITGKTVEEAIIQMRFSKKKAAKDVREHLEHAKNEAIVKRGMGLGPDLKLGSAIRIQTNKGKRVKVRNLSTMYIEQAWCGKGLFGRTPDHRARGQINIMKNRTTGLTLVLKEEKTRVRLHTEREEKEKKKKVWVQLPNRPITTQRQYYSW